MNFKIASTINNNTLMSLATWARAYSQYGPNNTEEFDSGMESKKAWD